MKIFLVDDQPIVREGVRSVLARSRMQVVAEASSAAEALALFDRVTCDVVVVDPDVADRQGGSFVERLRTCRPDVPVVILSSTTQVEEVVSRLRAGACAYVVKSAPIEDLAEALRQAAVGGAYIHPRVAPAVLQWVRGDFAEAPLPDLTDRERSVLRGIVDGQGNAELAHSLHVSPSTVKNDLRNLFQKFNVTGRSTLVVQVLNTPGMADLLATSDT